jgi:Na+-transporting NADH:ubiquinone oxidoreductase subunit C
MAVTAVVLVGLLAVVDLLARPAITRNEKFLENRAVLQAVGLLNKRGVGVGQAQEVNDLYEKTITPVYPAKGSKEEKDPDAMKVFRVLEPEGGKLRGYVFSIQGMGYWDLVKGYVAVGPDKNEIIGIVFTSHKETPGLGGEIDKPAIQQRFAEKKIDEAIAGARTDGVPIYIKIVPTGTTPNEHQVEAITGATRTSMALEKFLNKDIAEFKRLDKEGLLEGKESIEKTK